MKPFESTQNQSRNKAESNQNHARIEPESNQSRFDPNLWGTTESPQKPPPRVIPLGDPPGGDPLGSLGCFFLIMVAQYRRRSVFNVQRLNLG